MLNRSVSLFVLMVLVAAIAPQAIAEPGKDLLADPLLRAHPILFVTRPQYKSDHHNTATMFQTGEINTGGFEGGVFQSLSTLGSGLLGSADNDVATVVAGDAYYSNLSDFFFQVVFVATAMSIVSGAVAERMKLWSFFLFAVILTGFIYPVQGFWKWGAGWLDAAGFLDFAGSGVVHMCGAAAALAPRRWRRPPPRTGDK